MDLDQYYTPPETAHELVDTICDSNVRSVADGACGDGSLLRAAECRFKKIRCFGIDVDRATVRRLRRKYPHWLLSAVDMLAPEAPSVVARAKRVHDVVLLNPPFSMHARKFVFARFDGELIKCSVAMAHVLANLSAFRPRLGLSAIVPESLMYSELDGAARRLLSGRYLMAVVRGLRNTTFSGVRANSLMVRVVPASDDVVPAVGLPLVWRMAPECEVVRGGLPLHEAFLDQRGLPLIHSTELGLLAEGKMPRRHVRPIGRGVVRGNVVLLPRVGVPRPGVLVSHKLENDVQLSDCVVAVKFSSARDSSAFACALARDGEILRALYRGTGARYVTVSRLLQALCEMGARVRLVAGSAWKA